MTLKVRPNAAVAEPERRNPHQMHADAHRDRCTHVPFAAAPPLSAMVYPAFPVMALHLNREKHRRRSEEEKAER